MTNYVLLYTGGGMPATEEEGQAVMAAWGAWYQAMGEALVDGGNPFSGEAQSVHSDGSVHDSPVGVPATGYTIIAADSLAAATEIAKGCPHLQAGGQVSIYETFQVM